MYVIIDTKTGEELAYHLEFGKTLLKWVVDLEKKGRTVRVEEQHAKGKKA